MTELAPGRIPPIAKSTNSPVHESQLTSAEDDMYGARDIAESFRTVRKNTIQIADEIPAEKYSFKAAPDVKSVAELLAHIAISSDWQIALHQQRISSLDFSFFAARAPQVAAEEKALQTKEQILEALKTHGEQFAAMVEGMTSDRLAEVVQFAPPMQPSQKTRFEMLLGVKEHEMHHRGQLMLIERLLGIVPHLTRRRQAVAAART